MITWKMKNEGHYTACGEYALTISLCHPTEVYEGMFYREDLSGRTGDKPTVNAAKEALMDLVYAQIKKDVAAQSRTIAEFWDLKRSMERDKLCTDEKPETRTMRELIDGGYVQVSRKYHMIDRLPPGKTALEAIEERYPQQAINVREQCDRIARSQALALLGQFDTIELTPAQFAEFKRLKGPV
jgi:hypothetical protein